MPDSVIRVARLDGPTVKSALDLVDNAIAAEREGLAGRAYLDIGGPHPLGEGWLESIAKKIDGAGFDLDVDRESATLPAFSRFDAPVLYFGWYAWNLNGPLALQGFRFPPGAIAVHIQSYSAATLRSETENWCGPLVARGATATLGNVHEPYLQLTHRLDLFFEALLEGRTFGEAGYYSTPVLSWQGVLVGDPLYRPFAVPLQDQRSEGRSADVAAALVSRKVRLLLRDNRFDESLQIARGNFRERPCVAAGVLVAETLASTGDLKGAAGALQFVSMLERIDLRDVGVARHAADLLEKWEAPVQALDVRAAILRSAGFGHADEIALLEEAIRSAGTARKPERATDWERRLSLLKAPPAGDR